MKIYSQSLLLAFIGLSLFACTNNEDEPAPFISLRYFETKCADPWLQNANQDQTDFGTEFREYWSAQNVEITCLEIVFDNQYVELCEACNCQSGNVFDVNVRSIEEADILVAAGFER